MCIHPSLQPQLVCSLLACGLLFGCASETDSTGATDTTATSSEGPETSSPVTDQPIDAMAAGVLPADEPAADEPAADDGLLAPGSPAPAIAIAKWMQGEPVEEFEAGKVYVVEFWATWCGPCLQSMPHMAQLQTEYGDKVAFIGAPPKTKRRLLRFWTAPVRAAKSGQKS